MRRHANDGAEGAQEVIAAHGRRAGEIGERQRRVRLRLDLPERGGNPPLVAPGRRAPAARRSGKRGADRPGKAQRHLLEFRALAGVARRFGGGDDRQQGGMRRQTRNGERDPPRAGNLGDDRLQKFRREPERQAAVADAVLMAALEAMIVVAEEERARRQHRRAERRAILEGALGHGGDAHRIVAFLERPIMRAGRADHVGDAPAGA